MNCRMRILLVEDDYLQSEWVCETLGQAFPQGELTQIYTESQFRTQFEEIASNGFDVIIMDVMLRWADPSPDMPELPPDISPGDFYHAGIRCRQLLIDDPRTRRIPVLLYTVLEKADLPPNVEYLPKGADYSPLIERLTQLTLAAPVE